MSVNLTSLTARLQVLLDDPDEAIWSGTLLEECIRLAVAEVQRVCPYALTIAGMDDTLESNLDQDLRLSPLVLQLAQRQALRQRQVQRSERFHPDPQRLRQELLSPVSDEGFQSVLDQVRRYFLQRSSTSPIDFY
jgi:hypothetical protein